ncbi:MAG: hypothetical protein ACOZIN_07100 [Myxococcota bacterium]
MGKAVGAVAAAFSLGGIVFKVLPQVWAGAAESAALGMTGLALLAASYALGRKPGVSTASTAVGRALKTNG